MHTNHQLILFMRINPYWIFLFLFCFYGCGGGSDDPVYPEPTPTPTPNPTPEPTKPEINLSDQISADGIILTTNKSGQQSVSFTCSDDWTLTIKETRSGTSWITPSATSGKKGSVTVTFTMTENTSYDDRSVTVTIQSSTASASFIITQTGIKELLLTKDKYELPQQGGSIEIEIKANVDYQLIISESAQDWIIEQRSRGLITSKHTFIIQPNENTNIREGEIYIKSQSKTEVVKIHQASASSNTTPETSIEAGNNITNWNNGSSSNGNVEE